MQISRRYCVITIFMVVSLALSGCRPSPAPTRADTPTAITSTFDPATTDIPYHLISAERMLDHLEVLTNIQAYSGYRTAGTSGELRLDLSHLGLEGFLLPRQLQEVLEIGGRQGCQLHGGEA